MLIREKEALQSMVQSAHSAMDKHRQVAEMTARDKAIHTLTSGSAWQDYLEAAAAVFGFDKRALNLNIVQHNGVPTFGYGAPPAINPDVFQALWKGAGIPDVPAANHWTAHELAPVVNVALNTSSKKWDAISTGVYAFALAPKTNPEEFEKAVKDFLATL